MTSRILGIYHRRTLPWTQRQEKECPTLGDTGLWLVDFRSLNPFPYFWEKGHCLSRTLQPLGGPGDTQPSGRCSLHSENTHLQTEGSAHAALQPGPGGGVLSLGFPQSWP